MATIEATLQQVRGRVASACLKAGRDAQSVTLVAVTKGFGAASVREAVAAGQREFGENRVAEALEKMRALADLRSRLVWHLIGPLQSNKTRDAAASFDWLQSVDRLKVAQRLSDQRPPELAPLNVCIQVNISGEASKSGVAPEQVLPLARMLMELPRLRLRGLMAIPEPAQAQDEQRRAHRAMRTIFDRLVAHGLPLDTLSLGMSADLEAAVLEGSTMVRIGSAIFGARS
jgi:pyridoxal phosphate enzyme (YggS family)